MSVVLNLPPELESDLTAEAAQHGVGLPEYIMGILSRAQPTHSNLKTGADLIAYWQEENLIGTRPEISDPSAHARRLRDSAENRSQP